MTGLENGSSKTGKSKIDIEKLSENIGIDTETYCMILGKFYERTAKDIDAIEAGLGDGQFEAVLRSAHSIKGASANLGLADMSDLAREVEARMRENKPDGIPELIVLLRENLKIVGEMLS